MSFPDQSKLGLLHEQLTSQPYNLCLMVGGGFSKNATPIDQTTAQLPSWNELIKMMQEEISRLSNMSFATKSHGKELTTDDYLAVAQYYDDHFGRPELYKFLRDRIPDEKFYPGEMHARILKLPWKDVYTTNWDSLLERTVSCDGVPEYPIVRSEHELTFKESPKIIKLHGSLDPYYYLTVSAKDYEEYPVNYPIFVNRFQNALVDHNFLLIGFSGDDPNFEKWAGWVHDKLKGSGRKIYLSGSLELSEARIEYLDQELNVATIDMSKHPDIELLQGFEKHMLATRYILNYLENGPPKSVGPSRRAPASTTRRSELTPSTTHDWLTKVNAEPWSPPNINSDDAQVASIVDITATWGNLRRSYPGWLVAPLDSRDTLISKTKSWLSHVLGGLPRMSVTQRTQTIRELIWRHEVTLEPIPDDLMSCALEEMSHSSLDDYANDEKTQDYDTRSELREAYRDIALALVTCARYRFDKTAFDQRILEAEELFSDDPKVIHQINHEKCLWAAWSFNFDDLGTLLNDWKTDDCEPAWLLRKSALLSEVGRETEAIELVEQAVAEIDRMPEEESSLRRYSIEGWALWSTIDFDNQSDVVKRWNELASKNSDASAESSEIIRVLVRDNEDQEPPDFDGEVVHRNFLKFGTQTPIARSYRAIRLSELAGMPVAAPKASYPRASAAEMVGLAAVGLVQSLPGLAIRQILRSSTWDEDKSLKIVLARSNLANLDPRIVDALVSDCIRIVEESRSKGWVERLRVTIEVLSRLVPRSDSDTALEVFDLAMKLYRDKDDWITKHHWIAAPLDNLLKRSFATVAPEVRTEIAIDVLSTPVIGFDDFNAQIMERFPDPTNVFNEVPRFILPERTAEVATRWRPAFEQLIAALRENDETRKRVVGRLLPLIREEFFTPREAQDFANALWGERKEGSKDFPVLKDWDDWVFMTLPEPEQGLAMRIFRQKWLLNRDVQSRFAAFNKTNVGTLNLGVSMVCPEFLEDTLFNAGLAIDQLNVANRDFELTEREREFVRDMILNWSNVPVVSHDFPLIQRDLRFVESRTVYGISALLTAVEIPESTCEVVFNKLKMLTGTLVPAYQPTAALVAHHPGRTSEFTSWLTKGLLSRDRATVSIAIDGLITWLRLSHTDADKTAVSFRKPDAPSDGLVSELGNMLASRRSVSFPSSVSAVKWIFDHMDDQVQGIILDDVLIGLDYLSAELKYGEDWEEINVFQMRRHCAALAKSMARAGYSELPEVKRWLESASTDPFAEIRNELHG